MALNDLNSLSAGAALYFGGESAKVKVYEGTYVDSGDEDDPYRVFTATNVHSILSLHGWEVNAGWQFEEEYAQDSTFREGVAKHHFKVDVNATYGRIMPDVTKSLAAKIFAGGIDSPTVDGTVEDTSYVTFFRFMGLATRFNGNALSLPWRVTVDEVYFEGFNMPVQENKFIHVPLKGHGRTIKYGNEAVFDT